MLDGCGPCLRKLFGLEETSKESSVVSFKLIGYYRIGKSWAECIKKGLFVEKVVRKLVTEIQHISVKRQFVEWKALRKPLNKKI